MDDNILARVERFKRALNRLIALKERISEYGLGEDEIDILENNTRILIEALLDIARAVIAERDLGSPKTYKQVATILYENNLLSEREYQLLRSLAGLRNVIIHMYVGIDYDRLLEITDLLSDIEALMNKLLAHLKET